MRMLWRGKASAWDCDEMGHLNVATALGKASEALDALAGELGLVSAESPRAMSVLAPREAHMRYLAETRPGAAIAIEGGVSALDESSLAARLVMRHVETGQAAIGFTFLGDHIEAASARRFPWSARTSRAAGDLMVEPPPETLARGIALDPPSDDPERAPSLARADALGLDEIGRGVFRDHEADAFGRVRIAALQGRVSESATNLMRGETQAAHAAGAGGALLEARLLVRAHAAPGARFVIRSGIADYGPKVWRQIHWLLDPASGTAWASLEAVGVRLDLEARKAMELPDDARDALERARAPGLTI